MTESQPPRRRPWQALLLACLIGSGSVAPAADRTPSSSPPAAEDRTRQPAPAPAVDAGHLLRANNCTGCHQTDRKLVGPAFRAVARRHGDAPEAVEALKQSIRQGGGGRWGPVPMPPYPALKDEELQAIAEWIVSLR